MNTPMNEFSFTLKDDYAFKRLLGVEENINILQDFLECVLDLKTDEIVGLQLLDKELKKDRIENKTGILDIQVRLKDGSLIDVEIQRTWNKLFPERSFAYLAKMYVSSLKAGESFLSSNRCVGINIIEKGFNLTDKIHSIASFRLENTDNVLTKAITMHFLNLEKVRDLPICKGNTKEEHLINWMKIINAEDKEERKMLARTSPIFKLLNEKIEEITRSPEEERLFDSRMKMRSDILTEMEINYNEGIKKGIEKGIEQGREEGIEQGREEGIEQGREEGSYAKAVETARQCLILKMEIETISKITGLTREEIEKL
ncbi:MAG: Rpn family recombination-promoting nuclease/putative transposase [Treponema sp.]